MGRAKVELAPLKDHSRLRKWFPLSADAEGKKGSSNVTGDLELVVQWRRNPALAFAPFADEVEAVAVDANLGRLAHLRGVLLLLDDV